LTAFRTHDPRVYMLAICTPPREDAGPHVLELIVSCEAVPVTGIEGLVTGIQYYRSGLRAGGARTQACPTVRWRG
jgi:hypothetical protein